MHLVSYIGHIETYHSALNILSRFDCLSFRYISDAHTSRRSRIRTFIPSTLIELKIVSTFFMTSFMNKKGFF